MKAVLLTCLLSLSTFLFGQNNFPASWQGEWAGTLEIFTAAGKVQELPMELHILPADAPGKYSYAIVYGEDKTTGLRPYELVTLDDEKGFYLIDEKNSIRMEAYLLGGKLYQWFEVQGTLIFSTTELAGDELIWELVSGQANPASVPGGGDFEGEEIPPVKTFPVNVLQKAKLRKRK